MVTINLLPWRVKQARYEWRVSLMVIVGSMLCASLLLISANRYLVSQQQERLEQIAYLKKELLWREGLMNQMAHPASRQRDNVIDFFRRLNEVNTQALCFEQIKRTKSGIDLIGFATSSEQLTVFLQTSSFSAYFAELKINQLQPQSGQLKFNVVGKAHAI